MYENHSVTIFFVSVIRQFVLLEDIGRRKPAKQNIDLKHTQEIKGKSL